MNLSIPKDLSGPFKVPHTAPDIHTSLIRRLLHYLPHASSEQPIVVVCIGTDRSTGDSLGPLIGSSLARLNSSLFHLYGTLEEPVHAMNLEETLDLISRAHCNPFVIGIDACLGQSTSVGCIQLGDGPVRPGAGVNKTLPPVGDIHITGIVNVGGFMEYFVLQNTRLNLVMKMSEVISRSLYSSLQSRLLHDQVLS